MTQLVIVRHAETEWSLNGRHTGRTDIPLTNRGREAAGRIAQRLDGREFELILNSPLLRARETAQLAGFAGIAEPALEEWDYGAYEGLTTPQIREERPDWEDQCERTVVVAHGWMVFWRRCRLKETRFCLRMGTCCAY